MRGGPVRLLIIEDNSADVRLIREAIQEACPIPIEITNVSDGELALSLLKTGARFDLTILDVNLPKVTGLEVLERSGTGRGSTVVFTSSWSDTDMKRALDLGAQEFVRKPSTYDEYVTAVCEIIERWAQVA